MKIYFDIETSGFYVGKPEHKNARILKISAIKTDGDNIIDRFNTSVACGEYLPKRISAITGINNKTVKGAPKTKTALKNFKEFIGGGALVSYNIAFDMSFLNYYGNKYGIKFDNPQIYLLPLIKKKLTGKVKSFSITDVAKKLNVSTDQGDVDIIYKIGIKLKD